MVFGMDSHEANTGFKGGLSGNAALCTLLMSSSWLSGLTGRQTSS